MNVNGPSIKIGLTTIVTGRERMWDARTHTRQETNPHFISMPTKEQLVAWLQAITGQGDPSKIIYWATVSQGGSTDAPAGDCTAEHSQPGWIVRAAGPALQSVIFGGNAFQGIPPLLDESPEPPSENG